MRLAVSRSLEFSATRCTDLLDQARQVCEGAAGRPFLELSPLVAKSVIRRPEPWVFRLADTSTPVGVGAGILRRVGLTRSLAVVVATELVEPDAFFEGVQRFAREQRVSGMMVERCGEGAPAIPALSGEIARTPGTGFMIDLPTHDPVGALSKNHRRNVQRATRAGAQVHVRTDPIAAAEHVRLCRLSMQRVSERGERVDADPNASTIEAYLRSGCGALHQAEVGGRVLSSDLVVTVAGAAYYLSGGSSPEGMETGTAYLLMLEIVRCTQQAGCRTLNLGYPNGPGLSRFKQGFGAQPMAVERVEAAAGSRLRRALRRLVEAAR